MPILDATDAVEHEAHGSRFSSYVSPTRGSRELCAWRLTVPAGVKGAAHRPTREEVLLVLQGDPVVDLGGQGRELSAGDVVWVPADSLLRVDGGTEPAVLWVTTTPGLEAVLGDGSRLAPPWAS